jgi:hypothetical protein
VCKMEDILQTENVLFVSMYIYSVSMRDCQCLPTSLHSSPIASKIVGCKQKRLDENKKGSRVGQNHTSSMIHTVYMPYIHVYRHPMYVRLAKTVYGSYVHVFIRCINRIWIV